MKNTTLLFRVFALTAVLVSLIVSCDFLPNENLGDHTVSFDGNNNTGGTVPAPQTASYGSSITLPGPGTMTRTGYTFSGWNTSSAGTGIQYAAGASYKISGDTTLYVRWTVNEIKNPSLETPDPNDSTAPQSWFADTWSNPDDSFTATFTYLDEGRTGNRSVKVEITGFNPATTEGDAKWVFEPVQLQAGTEYFFSDYYRSNVDTQIIVECTPSSGSKVYIELPVAPASPTDWKKYEASFTMPENGVKATVFHCLTQNGWLITDDYHLGLYVDKGFAQGMLTITFDDAWELNKDTALPIMKQRGFKSTQFYATQYIKDPRPGFNPKEIIKKFIDAGHEIGSHSETHPDLVTLSAAELTQELAGSKTYLNSYLGVEIKHFAAPFGNFNPTVTAEIKKYYDSHCTTEEGHNSKGNLDPYQLMRKSVLSTTTTAEVKEWVEKARDEKLWLILLYHMVTDAPDAGENQYDHTSVALFTAQMDAIKNSGIQVKTISEALAIIKSQ
ncbi:MAG: polysaccharide deacetylase family protein [Treponema sp.]|jgi:uncharacterized repeat protein (TIGR02543 family)|nr:polysaccharide deacetylase family protein [Treponema sp.]